MESIASIGPFCKGGVKHPKKRDVPATTLMRLWDTSDKAGTPREEWRCDACRDAICANWTHLGLSIEEVRVTPSPSSSAPPPEVSNSLERTK